jgi:F-type H+-transporting ATPase subunit b
MEVTCILAVVNPGELLGSFGVDWHLLLIQALNFSLVSWALYRFGFRGVIRAMDERREKIESGLRYADDMRREKEEFARTRATRTEEARMEAEGIVQAAREDARALLERERATSKKLADGILSEAELEVARRKESMLRDVKGEVGDLVAAVAGRVLAENMSGEDRRRYVASAERALLEDFR